MGNDWFTGILTAAVTGWEVGSESIISQSIDGSTDEVTLAFGNADRVMVQVANDTQLRRVCRTVTVSCGRCDGDERHSAATVGGVRDRLAVGCGAGVRAAGFGYSVGVDAELSGGVGVADMLEAVRAGWLRGYAWIAGDGHDALSGQR